MPFSSFPYGMGKRRLLQGGLSNCRRSSIFAEDGVIGEFTMILTATSILEKRIRLTETQWRHIQNEHPEVNDQQKKIKETLEQPDFVVESVRDETYHYVRHYEKTPVSEKRFLLVVKHLNGEGFVITAFFVSRIRKQGKVVVYGREAYDQL